MYKYILSLIIFINTISCSNINENYTYFKQKHKNQWIPKDEYDISGKWRLVKVLELSDKKWEKIKINSEKGLNN